MYNSQNFNLEMTHGANTTAGYTYVSGLLCPSDSVKERPAAPWAPLNYAANVGGPGPISQWSGTIVPGKNTWYNNANNGVVTISRGSPTGRRTRRCSASTSSGCRGRTRSRACS